MEDFSKEKLSEIYMKEREEFIVKLSRQMHDKFFGKYFYIRTSEGITSGRIISINFEERFFYGNDIPISIKYTKTDRYETTTVEAMTSCLEEFYISDNEEEIKLIEGVGGRI